MKVWRSDRSAYRYRCAKWFGGGICCVWRTDGPFCISSCNSIIEFQCLCMFRVCCCLLSSPRFDSDFEKMGSHFKDISERVLCGRGARYGLTIRKCERENAYAVGVQNAAESQYREAVRPRIGPPISRQPWRKSCRSLRIIYHTIGTCMCFSVSSIQRTWK